jgi:hypothetical protein
LSHKLIASDRKSNSIHRCVFIHVRKRPIQSVSVSDNVLNIVRQITECLPLVNCLLWLPASIHRLFFLQLVKSAIHTIMNQDQRTHLIWKCILTSEISMNMFYPSKKKFILSSLFHNYHVHLNINLARLHLLSICAMLINVDSLSSSSMYTLPISNQEKK